MESMLKCLNKQVVLADLNCDQDLERILQVLDEYKNDDMGDSPPFSFFERERLKEQFRTYPRIYVFLAYYKNDLAGGAVCFNTFSTFTAMDVINIHDICILKEFRGLGLGREIMDEIIEVAKELQCSKVTLEVREDNEVAKNLYSSLGFRDSHPVMKFWSKQLF